MGGNQRRLHSQAAGIPWLRHNYVCVTTRLVVIVYVNRSSGIDEEILEMIRVKSEEDEVQTDSER
jgi:hypothetical protein